MPALLRTTLALLAGVVVTFFTISAVEQLGHILYRPPVGLDLQDSSAVSAYLKQLPSRRFVTGSGWLVARHFYRPDSINVACRALSWPLRFSNW